MPCIHPRLLQGGTDRGHLLAQRAEQWQAIDQALRTMIKTKPSIGNFYGADWRDVQDEHRRRLILLEEILHSIENEHATLIQGAHNGK